MKKKIILISGIIIIGLVFAFIKFSDKSTGMANAKDTLSISHRYGVTEVKKNPERVVVLDYGALDIIKSMGEDVIALPKSSLPTYLENFKDEKYEDVGSLKEFNMEKINELKPDLIIIEGRQGDYYDELSKIAPTIGLGTINNDHFKSLNDNVDILSKIYGKEDFGKKKIEEINSRILKIGEKVKKENRNALVAMVYDGNMSVYGPSSRFGMIYDKFLYNPVDKDIKVEGHGQNVSNEYILDKNPEYLFVIDKGVVSNSKGEKAKDIMENELIKRTDAYKNGKIIYLDTKTWYLGGAGIIATENMLDEMEKTL